ncbi:hypothetical protein GALL_543960 [mine drainage metagenome]|uniref:Uncharacterized protein n=1 Tax=mine drainage metagenome TaxID=410659 RepID=A0A1J5NXS0_9ZZZZ
MDEGGPVLHGQIREERAAEHLEHPRHDPAGTGKHHGGPPTPLVFRRALRKEPEKIHLPPNLHDQGKCDSRRGAEHRHVESAAPGDSARKPREVGKRSRVFPGDRQIGQQEQQCPERLRPELQARDQGDATHDQRNDQQRADQITPDQRQAEIHLQRQRHDGRLQREEDEGETRVDQRGDGGAEIAEAGAPREQIHVDAVARRVVADRQAGEKDDQAHHQNGDQGVGEAVIQCDRAADGLHGQERHGAECRVGHADFGPLAELARRVAQRIVFHRLVRHPGVVVAPNMKNFLGCGGHGTHPGRPCTDACRLLLILSDSDTSLLSHLT